PQNLSRTTWFLGLVRQAGEETQEDAQHGYPGERETPTAYDVRRVGDSRGPRGIVRRPPDPALDASRDGGGTWNDAGGGLPQGAEIAHLAISPTDGNVAYAADWSRIFKTADGGKTWTAMT
ncbi:MAG: hypothetical protein ACRETX_05980, partial [Steroidobacteraceae bacterium]